MTTPSEVLNTISTIDQPDGLENASAERRKGVPLRTASFVFVFIATLAALALFLSDWRVNTGYQRIQTANSRYYQAEAAANDLAITSDYLTDRVHCFVVTGEQRFLDEFLAEVQQTRRRETAVQTLESLLGSTDNPAYARLAHAQTLSSQLVGDEYLAMRLVLEAGGTAEADLPEVLRQLTVDETLQTLSGAEKRARAIELVFGPHYMSVKREIQGSTDQCIDTLNAQAKAELDSASAHMLRLLVIQTALTVALLAVVLVMVILISVLVRKPLTHMVQLMKDKKTIPPAGAEELRFVSDTYNELFLENQKTTERLTLEALHDGLTGLYNRNAYELLYHDTDLAHAALLIIDVDDFKGINDTYGHDMGDKVLKRVAEILQQSFRSVDQIYRFGGDEFVVIMTRANSALRELVLDKIEQANKRLQQPEDGTPPASISVGVAFCDRENPQGDLLVDADTALYRVKQAGRCGCAVY